MRDSRLDLRPGERFLDFQIVRVVGRGGVGVVYEVMYRGKRQALKLIRSEWVNDPAMVPRMINEGQILMRIHHPYIVVVHDAGMTEDSGVWIRMELLDGLNLREAMRRSGPMSLPRACAFLRTAAHAAHQCHVLGVIHRDIKPENFMVVRDEDGDEVLKLLDFGLAKLYGAETRDLRLIGTPQYMAPEQWNKEMAVTPATDVYAIATMIHELYVGHHPLFPDGKADNPWHMMKAHCELTPRPLEDYGMPAEISAHIMKALAKHPADRPQDVYRWSEDVWQAWRVVRDSHPEIDTYPGEPPLDRIRSRPLRLTAAHPVSTWVPPAETAPLAHAGTMRMRGTPQGLALPSPRIVEPAGGPRSARPGLTVRLPREQRDPSCVAAEPETPAGSVSGTAPTVPAGENRPLPPGTTGTVPISLSAVTAAVLPFRAPSAEASAFASRLPAPAPASSRLAATDAEAHRPARENVVAQASAAAVDERALTAAEAVTAPLERATSGVRRMDEKAEPHPLPEESRAAPRDAETPGRPSVEEPKHARPTATPATPSSPSSSRRIAARRTPAAARYALAAVLAGGALCAAWTLGRRSGDRTQEPAVTLPASVPDPSSAPIPARMTSTAPALMTAPSTMPERVPSLTATPASAPIPATAPALATIEPSAAASTSARPGIPARPAAPVTAASPRPPVTRPPAGTTSAGPSAPAPAHPPPSGTSRPRLPTNPSPKGTATPGTTAPAAPTAAPATKRPRLPTNPRPKLPAGPAPDPPGGPVLD